MDLHPYHGLLPRSGPQLFYHAKRGFGERYIVKTQSGEGMDIGRGRKFHKFSHMKIISEVS